MKEFIKLVTFCCLTLLLVVGLVVQRAYADGRDPLDNIDYYDCSGKADGNYIHPTDCTRFITCTNGRAADMACPDCGGDINPRQCAGSKYLLWDQSLNRCELPETTECIIDDGKQSSFDYDAPQAAIACSLSTHLE